MTARRGWHAAAWAGAGVLIAAGFVTTVIGLMMPVSFGWFAYQPLADAVFTPGDDTLHLSRTAGIGFAVLALGLIVFAFLAGRHIALRRTR